MVENVKRLCNDVQLSMLPDLEEFQHAQIKLHLSGGREGVPAKTERTRRQRKFAAAVSIEASQRIDWPAAPNYQDRRIERALRLRIERKKIEYNNLVRC